MPKQGKKSRNFEQKAAALNKGHDACATALLEAEDALTAMEDRIARRTRTEAANLAETYPALNGEA